MYGGIASANDYELGQGYDLGAWNISGYTTVEFKVPIQNKYDAELEIDDIALFVGGNLHQYLNPFFEIEYSSQPLWKKSENALSQAGHFYVERLYNDAKITNKLNIRFGKMLAPLGDWNQTHAGPLVATVNRPFSTFINFSEFISGVSLGYQTEVNWLPNIIVYYQPWRELLPKSIEQRPTRYKNVSGFNLQYGDEFTGQIALSVQHADLTTRNERQTLFSIDGVYDFDYLKLSLQLSYATIYGNELTRQRNHEWGGYIQVLAPIVDRWFVVGRSEVFMQRDEKNAHYNAIFGINYRPHSSIAWKLEYALQQGASLGLHDGVYGSLGIMF